MKENEEQFEPGQRIVPESFGDGFEWYEHALRLEQLREEQQDKIEMFLTNEEALIEAIEAHCCIMKCVSSSHEQKGVCSFWRIDYSPYQVFHECIKSQLRVSRTWHGGTISWW